MMIMNVNRCIWIRKCCDIYKYIQKIREPGNGRRCRRRKMQSNFNKAACLD